MTAYVLADISPNETLPNHKNLIQNYSHAATKTIKNFDGKVLAKSPISVLDGQAVEALKVIIAFPSIERANEWYNSEEYQAIIPIRNKAMTCNFQVVAGQ